MSYILACSPCNYRELLLSVLFTLQPFHSIDTTVGANLLLVLPSMSHLSVPSRYPHQLARISALAPSKEASLCPVSVWWWSPAHRSHYTVFCDCTHTPAVHFFLPPSRKCATSSRTAVLWVLSILLLLRRRFRRGEHCFLTWLHFQSATVTRLQEYKSLFIISFSLLFEHYFFYPPPHHF